MNAKLSLLQPITLKAASSDLVLPPIFNSALSVDVSSAVMEEVFMAVTVTSPEFVVTDASKISAIAFPSTWLVAIRPP